MSVLTNEEFGFHSSALRVRNRKSTGVAARICSAILSSALMSTTMTLAFSPSTSAQTAEPGWHGITTNGYMSLSDNNNGNDPEPKLNQFRVFDFNDDEPQLDVAQIAIQRAISQPKQFGFRFDMLAGSAVPKVISSYGLFRDTSSGRSEGNFDMTQLFVSYIAPLGKGLRFDAGKFATHMGYEVIGGYDGYNDEFSRGFIFGYGIPFTHTGLKATYTFTPKVTAMLTICNGWDDFKGINSGYTGGGQLALIPSKTTTLTFNFLYGPELRNDSHDQRGAYEMVGSWKPIPRLSLATDVLYGHEQNGVSLGRNANWTGFAGYAKVGITHKFSMAFRGEVFNDDGGSRTGTDQTLQGYTFTPEYDMTARLSRLNSHFKKADGGFAVRGEARWDVSNRNDFLVGRTPSADSQFTQAVNLIYLF